MAQRKRTWDVTLASGVEFTIRARSKRMAEAYANIEAHRRKSTVAQVWRHKNPPDPRPVPRPFWH